MAELEAVILAAGQSLRMGCNKLLLPWGDATVFEHFLSGFPFSLFCRVITVVADDQVEAVARTFPVSICRNHAPESGKSSSIRQGLAAGNPECPVLFSVADQPLLTATTVSRLVDASRENPEAIVLPEIDGRPASPVIFPAALRPELQALAGDSGGREVIARYPERLLALPCTAPGEFLDIDTRLEYQNLVQQWQTGNR